MAHPYDYRRLGPLLDRDALRAGDGASANRGRMVRDGTGQTDGKRGVSFVKSQERQDRPEEIFNVHGLGLLSTANVGFLLLGVPLSGALGFEVGSNALDGRCRCPYAS